MNSRLIPLSSVVVCYVSTLVWQNLFTAGTDTSSSTVEWALAELIRHPDVLKRAQLEFDSVVGRSRLVSQPDLRSLPLMQAVVKETFRLHPPTPLSLPGMASEACEVSGYSIPKGATLLVNIWAIAHDPASWPEPLEFRPARFLPSGDVKGKDFELIPIGAGRRVCAGMSLGIRMVQPMAATLVRAFDWRLPAGMRPENLAMEEAYGLTLQLSWRTPSQGSSLQRTREDVEVGELWKRQALGTTTDTPKTSQLLHIYRSRTSQSWFQILLSGCHSNLCYKEHRFLEEMIR